MTSLPQVRLGADGPLVSAQGLGCMGMTGTYGTPDLDRGRATLDAAFDAGVTFFDTADTYTRGGNEEFLAPFVQAHRDALTIATKCGLRPTDSGVSRVDNDPAWIREAVDASLRRLGVDVIDLYYLHRRDPAVPLADSVGTLAELVAAGKVRHLGLSEISGDELREAHAIHPIAAVQQEWSLFDRTLEKTLVPAAAELGVGIVPYSPLGRGFLTGSFTDAEELGDSRAWYPRLRGENARANGALLETLREIAADHDATLAQVALAWVHQRADRHGIAVVPIPGTTNPDRVRENVAAVGLRLSDEELAQLEPIAAGVQGSRAIDRAPAA